MGNNIREEKKREINDIVYSSEMQRSLAEYCTSTYLIKLLEIYDVLMSCHYFLVVCSGQEPISFSTYQLNQAIDCYYDLVETYGTNN